MMLFEMGKSPGTFFLVALETPHPFLGSFTRAHYTKHTKIEEEEKQPPSGQGQCWKSEIGT